MPKKIKITARIKHNNLSRKNQLTQKKRLESNMPRGANASGMNNEVYNVIKHFSFFFCNEEFQFSLSQKARRGRAEEEEEELRSG